MLAHKVIDSGVPNRFGCRIPVNSNWNLPLFQSLLKDYYDQDLLEWLEFGFPVSQFGVPDLVPADRNHRGATLFPDTIDQYLEQELKLHAIMGPFKFPPFLGRIGVSPLCTRPKRDSCKRRIILDLSFPQGFSVNDGIDKDWYCGERVKLTYPTIDMLTKRVFQLGCSCKMWKRDLARAFRLLPLCPANFSLIGYRWRGYLYFDKVMPMGLCSAAFVCQSVTNTITFIHEKMGHWSVNYLDDFGGKKRQRPKPGSLSSRWADSWQIWVPQRQRQKPSHHACAWIFLVTQ